MPFWLFLHDLTCSLKNIPPDQSPETSGSGSGPLFIFGALQLLSLIHIWDRP